MIDNTNTSKNPSEKIFVDAKKFVGVASVNILAINPTNAKLKQFGWNIPDNATEQVYTYSKTTDDGKERKSARICFLVQIQDFPEKPIVSLNYFVSPEIRVNTEGTKCKVIDAYGRTAWVTKDELKKQQIPIYSNGEPAHISTPFKPCHIGEDELVAFLFKYLNITPFSIFDRITNTMKSIKNPGKLTIDNWTALCNADITELASYVALQPDNKVKIVLGIKRTDDNKAVQTYLPSVYIGNGARVDITTGEYSTAAKAITKYFERNSADIYSFSAAPVKEWQISSTPVTDNTTKLFDENGNFIENEMKDDLPW